MRLDLERIEGAVEVCLSLCRSPLRGARRTGFMVAMLGAALLWLGPEALAQNSGRVSGIVQDQSGANVPGAAVVLTDPGKGTELRTVSDASGFYSIEPVPPAAYTLTVQLKGFKTWSRKDLLVAPASRLDIEVTLEVGQQVQTVEVTAQAGQMLTTSSGAKTDYIPAQQIQNLSTVGRNAMELLTLLPGVVNVNFDPTKGSNYFSNGMGQFSVNGLRTDMNDIRMDNAHMLDPGDNGGFIIEPNMDYIQEFSVKKSNFEADQGRSALIIDTVTKSGGSKLHGEAYFYARNAVFNANDWSNNQAGVQKPQSKFNYPGFNLGGPVRLPGTSFNKGNDKMFFFFGAEWQRQLPDPGTELATVPTAAMRTGDFSELLGQPTCATTGRYLNIPCIVKDPGDWGGSALPGNIIPTSKMPNPAADMAFLNLFPLPNADPQVVDPKFLRFNFAGHPLNPVNRASQIARLDYVLNESTRMFIRVAHEAEKQTWASASGRVKTPGGLPISPSPYPPSPTITPRRSASTSSKS